MLPLKVTTRPSLRSKRRLTAQRLDERRLMAVDIPCPLPPPPVAPIEWIRTLSIEDWAGTDANDGNDDAKKESAIDELVVIQEMSRASPILVHEFPDGNQPKIQFTTDRSGQTQSYLTFELKPVIVSGYSTKGDSESVDLNFTKIEFEYQPNEGAKNDEALRDWDTTPVPENLDANR